MILLMRSGSVLGVGSRGSPYTKRKGVQLWRTWLGRQGLRRCPFLNLRCDIMQLSDNISSLFPLPSNRSVAIITEPQDPSFFFDLKTHLDSNPEYRKARIEWRKSKPVLWDLWRIKDEFFQVYREKDLPTFHQDIFYFVRAHPEMSAEEGAKMFCEKWRGYDQTYGVEFVRRAIIRIQN